MIKISTLYKKDPNDLSKVINELDPENTWVFEPTTKATRKFDGTAAMIEDRIIYKRYDAKKGKKAPPGAIPCQEPDEITGHHPHWVECNPDDPADKYFLSALFALIASEEAIDGTYELCGEKIQGNPEKVQGQKLIRHGSEVLDIPDLSFEGLKNYLSDPSNDIEGIVFHGINGEMCKIRKKDFGIKR